MSLSDIVLPLHIVSLIFSAVGILLADHQAFNWLKGKTPTLDKAKLIKYHYWVSIGLGLMIATGFVLFWPMRDYLIGNTLFSIKMLCVVALVVNSFFIRKLMNVAIERPYAELTFRERAPLMISGAISGLSWLGAFAASLFLFG